MTIEQVQTKFNFDVENQLLSCPYDIYTVNSSYPFLAEYKDNKPCWTCQRDASGTGFGIVFTTGITQVAFDLTVDNIDGFCVLVGINNTLREGSSSRFHLVNVSKSYPSYGNYIWWNPDKAKIDDGVLDANKWVHMVIDKTSIKIYDLNSHLLYSRSKPEDIVDITLSSDENYQPYITNMIVTFNYSKNFLDTIGLRSLWSKIKSLFATKTELNNGLNAKANTSGTYSGLTVGNATNATNATNCPNYLPLAGGTLTGRLTLNEELHYTDTKRDWSDTSLNTWVGATVWHDSTGRRIHELIGANGGVWRKSYYINELHYFSVNSNRDLFFEGYTTFRGSVNFNKVANNDIYRDADNGYLALGGGSKYINGSTIILGGMSNSSYAGQAIITAKDSSNTYELKARCTDSGLSKNGALSWTGTVIYASDNICDLGNSIKRFKDIYATNATINTSDRNAKQDISVIDDKLLDVWGNINPVSFKFISSVEQKGDDARVHTGYIAQDVKEELDKYGIDACKYGLFCYNSWDAQEEQSHEEERTDEEGNTKTVKVIDTPAREAGETYGLRYIECLVVECAYLRKKNKELEDRITKLEENLDA